MERVKLDAKQIRIAMIRNDLETKHIAQRYGNGVSKQRINSIINSRYVRPDTATKLAQALNVDVSEIILQEN